MDHLIIIFLLLALSLGACSLYRVGLLKNTYASPILSNVFMFLILVNISAVLGILYNYYNINLQHLFSESMYQFADTTYRFLANLILLGVCYYLILFLRALYSGVPSKTYLVFLGTAWCVLQIVFIFSALADLELFGWPLSILINLAIDQSIQIIVLIECVLVWIALQNCANSEQKKLSTNILTVFSSFWIVLLCVSSLNLIWAEFRNLAQVLMASMYILLNGMPLLLTKGTLGRSMPSLNVDNLTKLYQRYGISKREQDIINLIRLGKTNAQISDTLHISIATVKDHNNHIFKKANVTNRTELASLFNSAG